ncbi:MAG TPA: ATP-binding protein [Chloroflexota bacterium]|nr:ATP-binding protein [Chloroflexota bacterium]
MKLSRWVIVATLAVGLLLLGEQARIETTHAPDLGLTARLDDGQLVVDWVQPGGWAWDAGVRPADLILAVDGHAVVDPIAVPAAQHLLTRSARDGATHQVPGANPPVPLTDSQRLAFLGLAGLIFAIGGAVFVLAADVPTASVVLGLATSAAGLLIAPTASTSGAGWVVPVVVVSVLTLGTCALLFFLRFPIDHLVNWPGRAVAGLSTGVGAVLVALFGWVAARAPGGYELVQLAVFGHFSASLLGAIALLLLSLLRRSAEQRAAGQAVRLVGLGTVAGLAPFMILSLIPYLAGLGYLVPPDLSILSIVFLPASLGAAVLSRQFLGIERLTRRGLVALVVWVGLIGLSGLVSAFFVQPLLNVSVTAICFSLVQRPLRRRIERLLFRDVYDAREVLQQMGSEIVLLTGVEPIARSVLARLGRTLDLTWAMISVDVEDRVSFAWGTPRDDAGATAVPLVTDNLEIGALLVGPKRQDVELQAEDRELLGMLAPLVATSLRSAVLNRRLEEQVVKLVDREVELAALSTRLMQVQEEERRRIALDLHDDPLQRAVLLARSLSGASAETDAPRWREWTEEIIVSLRALCQGLRPRTLDDFGLAAGLDWLLTDVGARTDLATSLDVGTHDGAPFGRLEGDLEVALYRVAQEAVNNAVKHAQASSLAVTLYRDADSVRLRIADDGRGLPKKRGSRGPSTQLGLLGMRERIAPWGGVVSVESAERSGTVINASVRCRFGAAEGLEWAA